MSADNVKISEEYKKYIDNYSEMIETKQNFVDVVRSMPGMFLGHRGNKGFLTMIREIFQNAVDQLILVSSPCNHISVWYNEKTNEVIVMDNGLGIPFGDMVRVYTEEYTSKNYTKREGEYSSGLHGVGGKCVNAASTSFSVESYKYDGTAMKLEMVEGFPTGDPYKIPNPNKLQGTKVTFVPSTDV
ncbi:MAG: ATP-binding protein, partial [Muribaculum sp.]|nr:ATP-binding protein [Muribaculum sp.]